MKKIFKRFGSAFLAICMILPLIPTMILTVNAEQIGAAHISGWYYRESDVRDLSFSQFPVGTKIWELTGQKYADAVGEDHRATIGDSGEDTQSGWYRNVYVDGVNAAQPHIVEHNGKKYLDLNKYSGAIYTAHAIVDGYILSYDLKAEESPLSDKGVFAVTLRGDQREYQTTDTVVGGVNGTSYFHTTDNNGSIGSSGINIQVTGPNQLAIVIKTAKKEKEISNRTVYFTTKTNLTDGNAHRYTVIDNGTDAINIAVDQEPVCTIRLNNLSRYDADSTSKKRYSQLYDEASNEGGVRNEKFTHTLSNPSRIDDFNYYRHVLVYSPTGIIVGEEFNALVHDYSRLAFSGRLVDKDMYFGEVTLDPYSDNARNAKYTDLIQSNTQNGVYLPITIRDFAADGVMFEYLHPVYTYDDGTKDMYDRDVTPPVASVVTHAPNMISELQTHRASRGYFTNFCKFGANSPFKLKKRDRSGMNQTGNSLVLENNESDGDDWIYVENFDINGSGFYNSYVGAYILYKNANDKFTDETSVRLYMYGRDEEKLDIDESRAAGAYYKDAVQCTDKGYEDCKILYVDLSTVLENFPDGGHLGGFRFDFSDTFGTSAEYVAISFVSKVGAGKAHGLKTHNSGANVNVLNPQIKGLENKSSFQTYTTFTDEAQDAGILIDSGVPDEKGVSSSCDQSVNYYGQPYSNLDGYIYFRYRVDANCEGQIFKVYHCTGTDQITAHDTIASLMYIADGQWHDVVFPVKSDSKGNSLRFDFFDGNETTRSVDVAAIKVLTLDDFNKYFAGIENDRGHLKIDNGANGSYNIGTTSYDGYSDTGSLYLYKYHHGKTSDEFNNLSYPQMAFERYDSMPLEKYPNYLQIRYKTDRAMTVTVNIKDNANETYKYTFKPQADGYWNVNVIDLNFDEIIASGERITDIYLTFDKTGTDGKTNWLEVGDLNFYNTVSAAYFYGSDKPTGAHNEWPNHSFMTFNIETQSHANKLSLGTIPGVQTYFGYTYYPQSAKNNYKDNEDANGDSKIGYANISQSAVKQALTEIELDPVTGKYKYSKETVQFVAKFLAQVMSSRGEKNSVVTKYGYNVFGSLNGEESEILGERAGLGYPIDMGTLITRHLVKCEETIGGKWSQSDSSQKFTDVQLDNITLKELIAEPTTCCYDVAYFLLNNMFTDKYAQEISEYSALRLVEAYDNNGNLSYTFDVTRSDTRYEPYGYRSTDGDTFKGIIYNNQTTVSASFANNNLSHMNAAGTKFNPLGSLRDKSMQEAAGAASTSVEALGQGDTTGAGGRTFQYINEDATYDGVNYHFTLQGSATFNYIKGAGQYFDFIGDDDVYLFINGKLAMDLGGAHTAARGYLDLDQFATDLGLSETEENSFDFFYVERHLGDANFAINTNIQFITPGMGVDKQGYQTLGDITDTSAKQDELTRGDNVDKYKDVVYEFSVSHTSKEDSAQKLVNISFDDLDIGVKLSPTAIDLTTTNNITTPVSDLKVSIYTLDANGKPVYTVNEKSGYTEEQLKQLLKNGISKGQTLEIYGIRYRLTDAQIGEGTFNNTVTVITQYDEGVGYMKELTSSATFVVNVSELHIYVQQNVQRDFNIAEIFESNTRVGNYYYTQLEAVGMFGGTKTATLTLCDNKGNPITKTTGVDVWFGLNGSTSNSVTDFGSETNSDPNVLNAHVLSDTAGMSQFMFTITYSEPDSLIIDTNTTYNEVTRGPFYVSVYTYDFDDKYYTLDYGLPVKVSGTSADALANKTVSDDVNNFINSTDDTLWIDSNPGTTAETSTESQTASATYGLFSGLDTSAATATQQNVTYNPSKFIEGRDYFTTSVLVSEGADFDEDGTEYAKDHITNGVVMTKKVAFIPASVMYYEENIGGITYENGLTLGGTASGYIQSANVNEQYGHDAAYRNDTTTDKDGTVGQFDWFSHGEGHSQTCGPIMNSAGTGGFDSTGHNYNFSNGTYCYANSTKVLYDAIGNTAALTFTFQGTGFELISFTNLSAAMIDVRVYRGDKATGTPVVKRPVSCTYVNGELYQVPVFSIKDIEPTVDTAEIYTVQVYVSKPWGEGYLSSTFYLDGIRIYNPVKGLNLDGETLTEKYSATEKNAEILSLREQIITYKTVGVGVLSTNSIYQTSVQVGGNGSVVEHINSKDDTWGLVGTKDKYEEAFIDYTYDNVGPNHECYIGANSALVFNLVPDPNVPVSERTFQIEARSIDPASKNSSFSYAIAGTTVETFTPNTYTSMYYVLDLSTLPAVGGVVTVGTNTRGTTISFTNIKVSGYRLEVMPEAGTTAQIAVAEEAEQAMISMSGTDYMYNEEIKIESVSTKTNVTVGDDIVLKVIASAGAERARVLDEDGNDVAIKSQKVTAYGDYTMITVCIAAENAGNYKYQVTVADSENRVSPVYLTKTISVAE